MAQPEAAAAANRRQKTKRKRRRQHYAVQGQGDADEEAYSEEDEEENPSNQLELLLEEVVAGPEEMEQQPEMKVAATAAVDGSQSQQPGGAEIPKLPGEPDASAAGAGAGAGSNVRAMVVPTVVRVSPRPGQGEAAAEEKEPLPAVSEEAVDKAMQDDSVLEWWKKCSGLHTVEKWVLNYRKHPAGWAALLMIHGIPEVTGRLRSKVENYAIYSALFLSFSIPTCMAPPGAVTGECQAPGQGVPEGEVAEWICAARKRLFLYLISFAVVAHFTCILLAMAFVNALNEAARDSDVFRMFARGKGFLATVKCQKAFRYGALANFIAMAVAGHAYLGWEVIVWSGILGYGCYKTYGETAKLLFQSASIVNYWRKELGGNPDEDDPYDLRIPAECFSARAAAGKRLADQTAFPKEGEEEGKALEKSAKVFQDMDKDGDGIVSMEEYKEFQEHLARKKAQEARLRQENITMDAARANVARGF